jgi:hypothetical protein
VRNWLRLNQPPQHEDSADETKSTDWQCCDEVRMRLKPDAGHTSTKHLSLRSCLLFYVPLLAAEARADRTLRDDNQVIRCSSGLRQFRRGRPHPRWVSLDCQADWRPHQADQLQDMKAGNTPYQKNLLRTSSENPCVSGKSMRRSVPDSSKNSLASFHAALGSNTCFVSFGHCSSRGRRSTPWTVKKPLWANIRGVGVGRTIGSGLSCGQHRPDSSLKKQL